MIGKKCLVTFGFLSVLGCGCSESVASDDCLKAGAMVKKGIALANGSDEEKGLYQEARKLCPQMAEATFNLGLIFHKRGELKAAEEQMLLAISERDDARFRVGLGRLLLDQGEYDSAGEQFSLVLAKAPKNGEAYQGLAVSRQKQGRLQDAIDVMERARLAISTDSVSAFNLAVLYESAHRYRESVEEYRRATSLDASFNKAWAALGMLEALRGNLSSAKVALERAIELDSENVGVMLKLAEVNERLGDKNMAQLGYRRVVTLDASNVAAYGHLGTLLIEEHSFQEAETVLEKAVSIASTNPQLWNALGRAQMEVGNMETAKKSFLKSIELDRSNAKSRNNLGVLYQRLGKREEASKAFKEALELDPSLTTAEDNLALLGE